MAAFTGLTQIRISGFRSIRDVTLVPPRFCGLVGEPGAGKSNVLSAIWKLLSVAAAPTTDDISTEDGRLLVEALVGERTISLESRPTEPPIRVGDPPPALLLPATLRSDEVVAPTEPVPGVVARILGLLQEPLAPSVGSTAAPALAFVNGLEACVAAKIRGVLLLIEEPELFLRPHTQRYLYRLLREFVGAGNQVLYSTHAPEFLNIGRLDELAFVVHDAAQGTIVFQPEPLAADESFRALNELDAERSELLLGRTALLVEGRTEKLVFPLIFRALGYAPDREAISIVECGGKPNIPLFARICEAARIPYLVVHDRDAPHGREPILGERVVNDEIARIAGRDRVVVLEPDLEGVAGLTGHRRKPERAWRTFARDGEAIPDQLVEVVRRTISLLRN
jgi:hypothetical protein